MHRILAGLALSSAALSPAHAQQAALTRDDCTAAWTKAQAFVTMADPEVSLAGSVQEATDGACVVTDITLSSQRQYQPNWFAQELRVSGQAVTWLNGAKPESASLKVELRGLHMAVHSGSAGMDYAFRAQSRAHPLTAALEANWDATTRKVSIANLSLDFPGPNQITASGEVSNVDFSSLGSIQMSATAFAVTSLDLSIRSHGLFETYALMPLAASMLPQEGEVEGEVARLQAEGVALVQRLPEPTFPPATKTALTDLIAEVPNPRGTMTLRFRSEAGFGPARLAVFAMTGVPDSIEGFAPLFNGSTVEAGWTHEERED